MRIVVDINHPAHVHYFKNFIWEMKKRGHDILITASEKDISYKLLDNYGFDYIKIGNYGTTVLEKLCNIPMLDFHMYGAVKKFKPDIFLGFGSIRAAHISKTLHVPCITFDDSEPSPFEHLLYVPFSDVIITPKWFRKDFGIKHIKYNGFIELAYLDPKYFSPNPSVLDDIGETTSSKFILMRFVSWNAVHDVGKTGLDDQAKIKTVKRLQKLMPVYISSESKLPEELEKYRINVKPENIHDILYYAHFFMGDSQTMTTEAAILGTPAIRCNSFVGPSDMGNFIELEKRYGLIYNYNDYEKAVQKAEELCICDDIKIKLKGYRDILLTNTIDVTQFMVGFFEQYLENKDTCMKEYSKERM